MRIGELHDAIASYGIKPPSAIRNYRLGGWWDTILSITDIGSGRLRDYTGQHVRRLVAWSLVGEATGQRDRGQGNNSSSAQRRQAMRLLAAASEGWVVLADGRAWWSLVMPVATLRSRCAVAIPVPEWRH